MDAISEALRKQQANDFGAAVKQNPGARLPREGIFFPVQASVGSQIVKRVGNCTLLRPPASLKGAFQGFVFLRGFRGKLKGRAPLCDELETRTLHVRRVSSNAAWRGGCKQVWSGSKPDYTNTVSGECFRARRCCGCEQVAPEVFWLLQGTWRLCEGLRNGGRTACRRRCREKGRSKAFAAGCAGAVV